MLKAIAPAKYADFLKAQGRSDQMENALEAFNYLTRLVESGEAQLISDINSKEMIEQNPYQSHLTGMFYKGKQGKPLAVVVPGGGFISNVTDCEDIRGNEITQVGVLRIGNQLPDWQTAGRNGT